MDCPVVAVIVGNVRKIETALLARTLVHLLFSGERAVSVSSTDVVRIVRAQTSQVPNLKSDFNLRLNFPPHA